MIASLAAAALSFGLATASLQAGNTTDAQQFTIVPMVPVIASSASYLETPNTEDIPPTYTSAETLQDYGNTVSIISAAPKPTLTYGLTGPSTSSSLRPGEVVHTERTHESLEVPTPPTTFTNVPAPIALPKNSSVAHPTLPTVSPSPVALTRKSSVAKPTLPVTYTQTQTATSLEPLIVHTEIPAESLEIPPSQTYSVPGHDTTKSTGPVPGANEGESSKASTPRQAVVTVPTTLVTIAPEVVVTMGGYKSTVTEERSCEPVTISEQIMTESGGEIVTIPAAVYTIPVLSVSGASGSQSRTTGSTASQVSSRTATQTLSGGEPSESETSQAGGGDESGGAGYEGNAASTIDAGLWKYSILGLAVGAVALI